MGKHYDDEFKNMVLAEYKKGIHGGRILTARYFGIPEGALNTWIRKDKKQGCHSIQRNTAFPLCV